MTTEEQRIKELEFKVKAIMEVLASVGWEVFWEPSKPAQPKPEGLFRRMGDGVST